MTSVEMLQELARDRCRCGAFKGPHRSFCHDCFKHLPYHLQGGLYKRFGQGYEQAFEAALEYLGYGTPNLFSEG